MPSESFDVVVIGGGPAGENAAGRCAGAGLRVALVERELVGGECSYWGCIPSKALLRPGDVVAAARRVPGADHAVSGAIDTGAALAWRDELISNGDDTGQVPWLDERGVTLVRGAGRLDGERRVAVTERSGATRILVAERAVVLATGTTAAVPPIEGLSAASPWDNRTATTARHVPGRLLVLGGGSVGAELAQAFFRLGSAEVTVVEMGPRLLAREEPFAGDQVADTFRTEGIAVVTDTAVTAVRRAGDHSPLRAELADGRTVEADEILVATGRRPNTASLGLDSVGLPPGRAVDVDDQLRVVGSASSWLYAVGDCNGRALLTHMGKYQARIAADVIAGRDVRDRASRAVVPRVTFTDPQVAAVGPTEAQAAEAGIAVRAVEVGLDSVAGTSVSGNGIAGTAKLVIDADREVIVGATFTGPAVQELLHAATVAVAGEVPLDRLAHAVPAFPTVSEVWLRLLEAYGL